MSSIHHITTPAEARTEAVNTAAYSLVRMLEQDNVCTNENRSDVYQALCTWFATIPLRSVHDLIVRLMDTDVFSMLEGTDADEVAEFLRDTRPTISPWQNYFIGMLAKIGIITGVHTDMSLGTINLHNNSLMTRVAVTEHGMSIADWQDVSDDFQSLTIEINEFRREMYDSDDDDASSVATAETEVVIR